MNQNELNPSIPTIDISTCLSCSSSQGSRDEIVAAVRSACQDYGFFQLAGHCIPLELQREALNCAKILFDLSIEEKQAMAMDKSLGMSKRGYEAIGGQVLDLKPDTKEGFYIGVEIPSDDRRAGNFLQGPKLWPDLPENVFRRPIMDYHAKVLTLHEILLKILAAGLSDKEGILTGFIMHPVANIKLLHYPPNVGTNDNEELSLGAGAHTDFGCTTILLQEPGQHGLQVLYPPTNT